MTSKIYIATMSLFIGGCVIHKRLQPDKMAGESPASYPAFFVKGEVYDTGIFVNGRKDQYHIAAVCSALFACKFPAGVIWRGRFVCGRAF